jgi:hypothetical protein
MSDFAFGSFEPEEPTQMPSQQVRRHRLSLIGVLSASGSAWSVLGSAFGAYRDTPAAGVIRPADTSKLMSNTTQFRAALSAAGLLCATAATADISIVVARLVSGDLWIVGRTEEPNADVTLEGSFSVVSDATASLSSGSRAITPHVHRRDNDREAVRARLGG